MDYQAVLRKIKSQANPENVAGMAKFGINPKNNYGLSVATTRQIAKEIGKDHQLALQLWKSKIREARFIACLIAEPDKVNNNLMEKWVKDFNSWDICDHCCGSLFDKTELAYKKAKEWSKRPEEFVKRAGFVLVAWLAIHDKKAPDKKLLQFLPIIKREAKDGRNFVKKAVNWALRHIGKRNLACNKEALKMAEEIKKLDSSTARWIAGDAIRELTSDKIKQRLRTSSCFALKCSARSEVSP